MAAAAEQQGPKAALAVLQAVLRRDLPALRAALQASPRPPLAYGGVGALQAAALVDWGAAVPLLVEAGANVDACSPTYGEDLSTDALLGQLGLTAEQLGGPARYRQPPLVLAVELGALETAAALLAAGAVTGEYTSPVGVDRFLETACRSTHDFAIECGHVFRSAWEALVELAAARSAAARGEAALAVVPPLVQRMAALLLERAPDASTEGALVAAHEAAALLAFPTRTAPQAPTVPGPAGGAAPQRWAVPCPWLMEHLLGLHASGALPDSWPAVRTALDLLLGCRRGVQHWFAGREAATEAIIVRWLRVPTARLLNADAMTGLGFSLISNAMFGALSALLELPAMRAVLQRAALQPPEVHGASVAETDAPEPDAAFDWGDETLEEACQAAHGLLASAAASGQPQLLDALLAAGGGVTLQAVTDVICLCSPKVQAAALRLLFSRGVRPVPVELPGATRRDVVNMHPIYRLLSAQAVLQHQAINSSAARSDPETACRRLQELHLASLGAIEALQEAGYCLTTFRNVLEDDDDPLSMLPEYFPPDNPASFNGSWELETSARWLWHAARRPAWSPATHASFPPAFRAAARALLLAAHRCSQQGAAAAGDIEGDGGGVAAVLGHLPAPLLLIILSHAAYPLSAWRPAMEGGRALEAALNPELPWELHWHFV